MTLVASLLAVGPGAASAGADVWPGSPAPAGPSSPSGGGGGGGSGSGGVACRDEQGWSGTKRIFDRKFYGCWEPSYSSIGIHFEGFDVWRLYGWKDGSGQTRSVDSVTMSRIVNARFGYAAGAYDMFAPHPQDLNEGPSYGNATFLDHTGPTEQGGTAYYDSRGAQVTGPAQTRSGPGCGPLRSGLMDRLVRSANPRESLGALGLVKDRYLEHLARGYPPSIAATMANLSRPPADQNSAASYLAVWDDGVPCSSTLEFAVEKGSPLLPQVVTCWMPTMRRAAQYRGGISPYDMGLAWRDGYSRYSDSDAYPVRGAGDPFGVQRAAIYDERVRRSIFGAFQPYIDATTPLTTSSGGVDLNLAAAATVAAVRAQCRESTAAGDVVDVPQFLLLKQTTQWAEPVSLGAAEVRPGVETLPVGGSKVPAIISAVTPGAMCRLFTQVRIDGVAPVPDEAVDKPCGELPADLRPGGTVSTSLSVRPESTGAVPMTECASATQAGCWFLQRPVAVPGAAASVRVDSYRATTDGQHLVASATNPVWGYRTYKVVRTDSCTNCPPGTALPPYPTMTWAPLDQPVRSALGSGTMPGAGDAVQRYTLAGPVSTPTGG